MIRGTIGFGQCDFRGAALTFDLPASAGNPGYPAFDNMSPGPGGVGGGLGAAKWFGNQMFTRIFDTQGQWAVGFQIMPFYQIGSSTLWALDKFLQISSATLNLIALEIQTNGKLAVVAGGDGTSGTGSIVGTSTQIFPVGSWSGYLEILAVGLGGSTVVQVFLNDVQIILCTVGTASGADRIALGTQNGTTFGVDSQPYFGLVFANVYCADGQGSAPFNTRLGPVRITTVSPNADAGGNWTITPGSLTSRYVAVDDIFPSDGNGSPDGDHSYITNVTLDPQWFTFGGAGGAPCYGRILGVMVNLCFRGASGSTTCNALLLQQATQTSIGTATVNGLYQTQQLFQALSPATGTYFTTGEVAGSLWGVSTSSTGLMLTQMFLEEVVSLRSTPYDCGQASYSF